MEEGEKQSKELSEEERLELIQEFNKLHEEYVALISISENKRTEEQNLKMDEIRRRTEKVTALLESF